MPHNRLTHKTLRALKPDTKEQVLGDGGGLWLRVLPETSGGAFNFYYRFSFNGKERRYNCGSYPETSLAEARTRRDRARVTDEEWNIDQLLIDGMAVTDGPVLVKFVAMIRDDDDRRHFVDAERLEIRDHLGEGGVVLCDLSVVEAFQELFVDGR